MVRDNQVRALDGSRVHIRPETLCLHGDGPHAVVFAGRIRQELGRAGITVCSMQQRVGERSEDAPDFVKTRGRWLSARRQGLPFLSQQTSDKRAR